MNLGTKTYPLTRKEAAFIAESLTAAVSGKPATALPFTRGMHGHISVMSKKAKPVMHRAKKQSRIFRSNPPQSDHVLTGC
nr:hypothetical protein [Pantoea sp. WMus005]